VPFGQIIAANLVPSAELAMDGKKFRIGNVELMGTSSTSVQVPPESGEVYTEPLKVTAASLVPSAELATEYHALLGAPQALQVAPESVDVSINPSVGDAATNLAPSADEATDVQTEPTPLGALVEVQSCALERLTIANSTAEAAVANTTHFVFICVSIVGHYFHE
jgi:hypothetical protein